MDLQTMYERRRDDSEIVFSLCRTKTQVPAPIDMHNFLKRTIKPIGAKLGMPWLNLHCLRHTTSTWLDVSGMAMGQRLAVMGHASLRNSMRYIHPDIDAQREALEAAMTMKKGSVN